MVEGAERTPAEPGGEAASEGGVQTGRPFIGMHFKCCHVYSRIYIDRDCSAYVGACPRCGAPIKVRIGPGGTDDRFFEAI